MMSFRGWRVLRQRTSASIVPFYDQFFSSQIQMVQKASASNSSQSFLLRIREISSATISRIPADDPSNGGPKEPPDVPLQQDKVVPEGAEDRRMWRKWIEERLAQSTSAGEEAHARLRGRSQVRETVTRTFEPPRNTTDDDARFHGSSQVREQTKQAVAPERRRSSLFDRGTLLEEDGEGPSGSEDSSTGKKFAPFESIFRSALKPTSKDGNAEDSAVLNLKNPFRRGVAKPSLFSDRASNRSGSSGDRRGPLLQESAKGPSFFSARQGPRKGLQAPSDNLRAEALDDFETRVLGSANDEDDSVDDDFLRDLEEIGRSARGMKSEDDDNLDMDEDDDWNDEKAKVLTDYALSNMEMFDLEDDEYPYRMRSDRLFFPGQTYDPEDLDISKEAPLEKPTVRTRKKYPSKEVFQVADFRNPRYLSNFIRESSRMLPRRHFQISAKAQRKVAREIKTARILGLMPFTSMGDPPFRFLRSRSEDGTNGALDVY